MPPGNASDSSDDRPRLESPRLGVPEAVAALVLATAGLPLASSARAGQAPGSASEPEDSRKAAAGVGRMSISQINLEAADAG